MSIEELLQLEYNQASIKKIDLFLSKQIKLSDEYMIALAYKVSILHHLGKSNDALKQILPFINQFKIMGYNAVIASCDAIIEIYLDSKSFDEALKYISLKKNYLPASRLHLYLKDKIRLYLAMGDNKRAKESLLNYLSDDLMKEEGIEARENLAKIYFLEKQYDKFLELSKILEAYYSENVYLDKLNELELARLTIAYNKNNYLKVVTEGDKYINEINRVDLILRCASLCIKSYLALEDYKKATIYESYYEDYATEEHPLEALEFSKAALELYTKTNSLVSIKSYQDRINKLENLDKPKEASKRLAKKEEILITADINKDSSIVDSFITPEAKILNPEPIRVSERVGIQAKPVDIKKSIVSENYKKLIKLISNINNMSEGFNFRECFRKSMIELKKGFSIDEVYLLYYKKDYHGLYFKSDRAYDRSLKFNDIENTISYAAMKYNDDVALDLATSTYKINIATGLEYDPSLYSIAIPLSSFKEVIGSITFIAKIDILNTDMLYEILKLTSEIVNNRLLESFKEEKDRLHNEKLYFLKDNMKSGIKEYSDGYIHLNKRAKDILNTMEDLTINDFYLNMKPGDIIKYKALIEDLNNNMTKDRALEYDYKIGDKYIRAKESFYPFILDGSLYIYSIIDDITKDYNDKESLISLAYRDPASGLETITKLRIDLDNEISTERLSLAILEACDFNLYTELYGHVFSNQLILAIAEELKKATSNDFNINLYSLERDRFAILFKNLNDKRLVDSRLKEILLRVKNGLNKLNKRVDLCFRCGVFRLLRNTRVNTSDMIIGYAYEALTDSLELNGAYPHIAHYNSDIAKERMNRDNLVTHISESIDSNKLSLTYQQIVDIENKEVYGYNAIINLDNYIVDKSYMDMVIDRRGLRNRIDRYSIRRLIHEERMLYEEIKGYIPMFIEISDVTLDSKLYDYINTLINHYRIERENIVFIAKSNNSYILDILRKDGFKVCSHNILDIYQDKCDYYVYDYDILKNKALAELKELCMMHRVELIIGGISSKDEVVYLKENGYKLIYGPYYKRLNRIQNIIDKL